MSPSHATEARTRSIPYERIGGSALFLGYVNGEEKALQYFVHNPWTEQGRAEAARIAANYSRDREALVEVLLDQNRRWMGKDGDRVGTNIERLRASESVAVVTGQQLGLFGGPLYTVYKALTAVKLAERLEAETGRPAVPVFWLADEDHDFAEVHATTLPNGANPVRIAYQDGRPPEMNRRPVGRIVLGQEIVPAVEKLSAAFPQTPEWVHDFWRPGELWRDAFALTLRKLVEGTGLVFASGDDARLKRLAAPIFRREIETGRESFASLVAVSERLESDGYHAQIRPGGLNLFLFHEDQRVAIDPSGDGFKLRGTEVTFSKSELLARLDEDPARFSPNVVLRPLMQDTLFPTAAYVGGPGEIAYFAQLKPVYEAFGVPIPLVFPRASLTLVSKKPKRFLKEYVLDLPDLGGAPGTDPGQAIRELHRRLALERSDVGLVGQFESTARRAHELIESLKPTAAAVDTSLGKAVEAAQAAVGKAISRLERKTVRAEMRNHQVILDRLERLVGELMPGGVPQERVMCALSLLGWFGAPEFLALDDGDARAHVVLNG